MNAAWNALRGLRVGCVRYLNARPLIEPYDGEVTLDHPSALAVALQRGELDVALIPVYEALRMPGALVVDGVGIASRGEVWSVILAWQGEFANIREIALDPASRTSVHLCQVLLAHWSDLRPVYVSEPAPQGAARVLIGNQAIAFRQKNPHWQILDLGQAWWEKSGLPFVFALWVMRPGLQEPARVAAALRDVKCAGRGRLEAIIAQEREYEPEFVRRYLTQWIRFEVGDAEKAGLDLFRELLCRHALLPGSTEPLHFV